ncbi:MAG: 3-hydroxyacyl-ACP dehydratase [Proteobacteria bacterium]|nr:3-hydroxyacyl-ACP dehydratase [Pseudomonadota bacterium]
MVLGVDLGSRTIKLAAVAGGELVAHRIEPSGFDPAGQAARMLAGFGGLPVIATGYGRHLAQKHFARDAITEIKAHALGARQLFPECRTVVDVGGQDAKVILLDARGRVARFQMNDKCAAGTGRFLEIMAATLGWALPEFGPAARGSDQTVPINSMCTVFAESEVVSLKNQGVPPADIARAVHLSVVDRLAAMLERLGWEAPVVFSGGVAHNPFVVEALATRLGVPVAAAEHPDLVGALGAALHGARQDRPAS